jgi:hypothetical protein
MELVQTHYRRVCGEYHGVRFVVKNFLVIYTPRSSNGFGTLARAELKNSS